MLWSQAPVGMSVISWCSTHLGAPWALPSLGDPFCCCSGTSGNSLWLAGWAETSDTHLRSHLARSILIPLQGLIYPVCGQKDVNVMWFSLPAIFWQYWERNQWSSIFIIKKNWCSYVGSYFSVVCAAASPFWKQPQWVRSSEAGARARSWDQGLHTWTQKKPQNTLNYSCFAVWEPKADMLSNKAHGILVSKW